jgi:hypothetical protein
LEFGIWNFKNWNFLFRVHPSPHSFQNNSCLRGHKKSAPIRFIRIHPRPITQSFQKICESAAIPPHNLFKKISAFVAIKNPRPSASSASIRVPSHNPFKNNSSIRGHKKSAPIRFIRIHPRPITPSFQKKSANLRLN